VADPAVADRNGRQLGFAALSGLEGLPAPGTRFAYAGPIVSGAVLGTWEHQKLTAEQHSAAAAWTARRVTVELPYRPDLPTAETTRAELAKWEVEETAARIAGNSARLSECRARAEQMTRQLARLSSLPPGRAYPLPVGITRVGTTVWVFIPGELYQSFQLAFRREFPEIAILIATVTNDWQPGYIPPATSYGLGIYQEKIGAVAPGCLEALTAHCVRVVREMLNEGAKESHPD
jgi:hypothetical protein